MSACILSRLLTKLVITRSATKGVHHIPYDFNRVNRGDKYYVPPPDKMLHKPNPKNRDPNYTTTFNSVKIIHGPQHKLQRDGGRDPETGRKIFMCRGGGVDRQMRETMNHRVPEGETGVLKYRVIQIQECEVRNADLALIAGPTIEYIVQPEGLNVGDIVYASRDTLAHINPGSSYAMKLLPIGSTIHCVEPIPGLGGTICRVAGSCCELVQHSANREMSLIQYPSGIQQWLDSNGMCTLGRVKQTARAVEPLGSWKASRAKGRKPRRNRQRPFNWRKRKLRHRRDQKWAKRILRWFNNRIWAGQEGFHPGSLERFRYYYGDRKPEYFIRKLRARDPATLKVIDTRKYEPREERPYQCSYETLTDQRTEVFWMRRERWRRMKEIKRSKK